ncbi:hypothetical protein OQI_33820 [Streptomyces pharetrae CZA14]|uniref:Uncharacterized protein n=1 Tax=Streptomyces pharetrae CZA14 TaxID=1144883 RepID=A0ABX3Y8V6_9ACTN|nr:hypothetical protein OQI_33820 [Streptomyces pharetrae CZA14]
MSALDQHAEAHRLRTELGYGARRVAEQLGITRHAATQLLARPLADRPAEVADPVAAGGRQPAAAVAATDGQDRRPVAELRLPRRVAQPLAGIDVSQWPALRRDLAVLAQCGRPPEALVHQAVTALAHGYRRALDSGHLEPGQPFLISDMTLRPAAQLADRPVTP